VPLDAGWIDVASWSSLWECVEQDSNNNALHGDVMLDAMTDSYVHSERRLV